MVIRPAFDELQSATIYALNTTRGITNIGSHPDNDIVVNAAGVAPFHLMIDHRQKPYRVIILNPQAEVCIHGGRLAGAEPKEVTDLGQVSFCGYALRPQGTANGGPLERVAIVPLAGLPAGSPPSGGLPTNGGPERTFATSAPGADGAPPAGAEAIPTADPLGLARSEDVILLDLKEPALAAAVEQSAVYHLSVLNGGPIVAAFSVAVEGVPPEWVTVRPEKLNLYEGTRAVSEIRICPPRDPSSLAKTYPLRFRVTSPNYPGIYGETSAELNVLPYQDFTVGSLSPRSQSLAWGKKSGQASLPITNLGNSRADFQVSAQDEENGCLFGFPLDQQVGLVKQVQVPVAPGQTFAVPLTITPLKRSLVRLRNKSYAYTVTAAPLENPTAQRSVAGSLASRPLFGLLSILLLVAAILVLVYLLLTPRISSFGVKSKIIRMGEPALLTWKVSAFTSTLQIPEISEPLQPALNSISIHPTQTISTYTLIASNWLSNLLRMDIRWPQPVTVLAIPSYPEIATFTVDRVEIFEGDEITIKWSTRNAQKVLLTIEGVTESLDEKGFSGERVARVKKDSLVILEAINNSGSVLRSEYIHAIRPNPSIQYFTIKPTTVTKGDPVTVSWAVEGQGIESVIISPFKDPLPPTGQLTFFPETSMEFVMTVKSRGDKQLDPLMRSVGVLPQPGAPVINFFKVVPTALTIPGNVEISWSVTGATTDIVLTSTDGDSLKGLPAQGFRTISIKKTTSLMLTAYNGKLSAAEAKDVELNALKPVKVEIVSVVPNQAVRVNDTIFVTVSVLPLDKDGRTADPKVLGYPEISGTVKVSTGYDNCDIALASVVGCSLKITKIVGHTIVATYFGDDNYARTPSEPWEQLDVQGNPVSISATPLKANLLVGESTSFNIQVSPLTASTPPDPGTPAVKGKVNLYYGGTNTTPICENLDLVSDPTDPFKGVAACNVVFTSTGAKTLTIHFFNSDTYVTKDQLAQNIITVSPAPVTLKLTDLSTGATVAGEPFDVQVAVSANPPARGTPTGTITVKDSAANHLCTATLSAGLGTCALRLYNAGGATSPRTLEATYQPDTHNFLAGALVTAPHVVNQASATITAIHMDPPSGDALAQYGASATATVTLGVLEPGSGSPTGVIDVLLNNTPFCSIDLSSGRKQCAGRLNSSGAAAVTAIYQGDVNYRPSPVFGMPSAYVIQKAPTTLTISDLTHTSNPAGPGEIVTLYYSVALSNGLASIGGQPAGTIRLNGNPPGNEVNAGACVYPASPTNACSLTLGIEGQRTVKVTFDSSDPNVASASASRDYFVKKSSVISLYGYQMGPIVGQEVTFYYSVVSKNGIGMPGTPAGSVSITAQSASPAATINCLMVPNTNSCRITFRDAVPYTIRASYTGDTQFASSSAAIPPYAVNPARTTLSNVAFSANPVTPGAPFIASFQVINLDTNLMPSGTAWVITDPGASLCGTDFSTHPGAVRAELNSTTGTGYTPLSVPSKPYTITIWYTGTTNFSPSCYSGPIEP